MAEPTERDLVTRAVEFLAMNAASTPAYALILEMSDEILRLRAAKTAALKVADERGKEVVELRAAAARNLWQATWRAIDQTERQS